MKVLVTGGAGFIGSHLVDALIRAGHSVAVVDNLSVGRKENLNPKAAFHSVDIRDAGALEKVFEKEQPEAVNHHAAQTDVRRSMADPSFDAQVNVLGFIHLLQSCVKHQVRKVVFASSSAVYPEPQHVPVDEEHPVQSLSAYGLSKYLGEKYLEFYRDVYRLPFTIFRYGNVYGPRQDPKGEAGVVAIFATQMLSGIQPTLYGDGNKTRDYIHVEDVVAANLLAMDGRGAGGIFNLGWGKEVKDIEVFQSVREMVGVSVEPRYAAKRPGELDRIALDCRKARKVLGWEPKIPFSEGVRETLEYYAHGCLRR